MAGLAITNRRKYSVGKQKVVEGTCTFDSSYPTGGEALTASGVGLLRIDNIDFEDTADNSFTFDYTNNKVLAYVKTTGVEVANAVSLATTAPRFRASGL